MPEQTPAIIRLFERINFLFSINFFLNFASKLQKTHQLRFILLKTFKEIPSIPILFVILHQIRE